MLRGFNCQKKNEWSVNGVRVKPVHDIVYKATITTVKYEFKVPM